MRLVTFSPFRSLEIAGVRYIKPESMFRHRDDLLGADFVLFPEYWQVNALVYGLNCRVFPSAASYHLGHDKVEVTRGLWAVAPRHVPHTLIAARNAESALAIPDELGYPFVAKVPRSAMGRGVHLVEGRAQWLEYVAANPVLYAQELLPIRRDLRVVVVGDRAVCAYWREAPDGGFHNNVAQGASVSFDDVPSGAVALVERVAHALGVDHAGFDLAEVGGQYYFLEFNPLFGNTGLSARGVRLGRLIVDYLERRLEPQDPDLPRNPDHPGLPLAS
jgi:glutathione synthase/RimK-type ligase-like ATP-grasp enzyme